jgi:polyhydroxyalkanoate synthesis regulator phasin
MKKRIKISKNNDKPLKRRLGGNMSANEIIRMLEEQIDALKKRIQELEERARKPRILFEAIADFDIPAPPSQL